MSPEQRLIFDEVAELYDRARPAYPGELVDDVMRLAGIPEGGRVLELGAGTGQATRLFAARGCEILCLEPGPNMARVALEKLAVFPEVDIEVTTFEAWPLEPQSFDLVIAAQASHWVDPEVLFEKAADSLRPEGGLAIFWNRPLLGAGALEDAIQAQYLRIAPELSARLPGTSPVAAARDPVREIQASNRFGSVSRAEYAWQETYTAEGYANLMKTQSNHRLLAPNRMAKLHELIEDTIESFGDSIVVSYVTELFFARRLS